MPSAMEKHSFLLAAFKNNVRHPCQPDKQAFHIIG
jgi:hypothetical protein